MIKHESTKLRKMSARIDEGLLDEFLKVVKCSLLTNLPGNFL